MSSGLTPVFHQEMLNYKLKPSYEYQESMWKKYKADKDKKLMSVKSFARAVWFASILYTKRYRHSIYIRTVSFFKKRTNYFSLFRIFLFEGCVHFQNAFVFKIRKVSWVFFPFSKKHCKQRFVNKTHQHKFHFKGVKDLYIH